MPEKQERPELGVPVAEGCPPAAGSGGCRRVALHQACRRPPARGHHLRTGAEAEPTWRRRGTLLSLRAAPAPGRHQTQDRGHGGTQSLGVAGHAGHSGTGRDGA